ncbi:MAG: YdbH domain-containing protein [Sodalis sp. (in: enterobacteria)]|uniref:intermembrane phospholipid transport protein YdbH family protein n=1 Tax=Sodalis sp. (in: enterobacteria) TaxID=1898979 RepID=UPI0039E33DA2
MHIDEIISPIALRELDTGLKGFYPFDDVHPLTLTHVTLKTLGGQVSLTPLRLPQHAPAVLKVQSVEMSELITALKPKQFAMSGRGKRRVAAVARGCDPGYPPRLDCQR